MSLTLFRRLFSGSSSSLNNLYFNSKNNILLGRWNIHYDDIIIKTKVEQANEDHCGVCIINKTDTNVIKHSNSVLNNDNDEYYKAFIM